MIGFSFRILILFLIMAGPVSAVPSLQLDVEDGTYYTPTETIVSTDSIFTLYALADPNAGGNDKIDTDGKFYISAAVTPKLSSDLDLGSFVFLDIGTNVTTIVDVTGDMEYGNAPPGLMKNSEDLQSHGIFDTYFIQFEFTFNTSLNKTQTYNSQDNPGGLVTSVSDGEDFLYYAAFDVDVSNLNPAYEIHFDLYTLKSNGTVDVNAPFSHDAESGGDLPDTPVPEPATFLLFGFGLLGLSRIVRKKWIK